MKLFWTKLAGVVLVILILVTYQGQARKLSAMRTELEQDEKKAEELLKQSQESNGSGSGQSRYEDGTFTGTGTGFSGDMTCEVTVKGGKITNIEILETNDDSAYLDKAKGLIDEIISKQTTDEVDTVSGATYSSNGIISAVEDALSGDEG